MARRVVVVEPVGPEVEAFPELTSRRKEPHELGVRPRWRLGARPFEHQRGGLEAVALPRRLSGRLPAEAALRWVQGLPPNGTDWRAPIGPQFTGTTSAVLWWVWEACYPGRGLGLPKPLPRRRGRPTSSECATVVPVLPRLVWAVHVPGPVLELGPEFPCHLRVDVFLTEPCGVLEVTTPRRWLTWNSTIRLRPYFPNKDPCGTHCLEVLWTEVDTECAALNQAHPKVRVWPGEVLVAELGPAGPGFFKTRSGPD